MEDKLNLIQAHIVTFCASLPIHVESWKSKLNELHNPVKIVTQFSEQIQLILRADVNHLEHFASIQDGLRLEALLNIEEELDTIRHKLDMLGKSNKDLRNRLSQLEEATVDIDWDSDSPIIKGSPVQPPLRRIIELGYHFWLFYSSVLRNLNSTFTKLNFRQENTVQNFLKSFSVECNKINESEKANNILALTQYVNKDL